MTLVLEGHLKNIEKAIKEALDNLNDALNAFSR